MTHGLNTVCHLPPWLQHDMEDGDVLDCMIEQVGGSH